MALSRARSMPSRARRVAALAVESLRDEIPSVQIEVFAGDRPELQQPAKARGSAGRGAGMWPWHDRRAALARGLLLVSVGSGVDEHASTITDDTPTNSINARALAMIGSLVRASPRR